MKPAWSHGWACDVVYLLRMRTVPSICEMRGDTTTTTLPPAAHFLDILSKTNGRVRWHIDFPNPVGSHTKVSFPLQIDSITDRCSDFSIRLGVPSRWRA